MVIFQDFNYGPYQVARYLPRIREYVLQRRRVRDGRRRPRVRRGRLRRRTPIAEILPVTMSRGHRRC